MWLPSHSLSTRRVAAGRQSLCALNSHSGLGRTTGEPLKGQRTARGVWSVSMSCELCGGWGTGERSATTLPRAPGHKWIGWAGGRRVMPRVRGRLTRGSPVHSHHKRSPQVLAICPRGPEVLARRHSEGAGTPVLQHQKGAKTSHSVANGFGTPVKRPDSRPLASTASQLRTKSWFSEPRQISTPPAFP